MNNASVKRIDIQERRSYANRKVRYSAKIIKAGALLADTKTLLSHWDTEASVHENIKRIRNDNLFGKASRSRVDDIVAIFRQRYLCDEAVTKALVVRDGVQVRQTRDNVQVLFRPWGEADRVFFCVGHGWHLPASPNDLAFSRRPPAPA